MWGSSRGGRQTLCVLGAQLLLLGVCLWPLSQAAAADRFGPFGPEAPRMREQLWILPSGDPNRDLRATVFRPARSADSPQRHPLVVINHGTSELTRLSVSMPVFYWLSRWFVDRGYVVVLPQRRGHGATGGELSEDVGTCAHPDHYRSGEIAADDIEAAVAYMNTQPFVASNSTVVVGVSTGGWASLALASRNPANVRAVVNFAGGRGGHAYGESGRVCGERELVDAAGHYASSAKIPTIWFYARNDSYFGPKLARKLAAVWKQAGAPAALHVVPAYGSEGHNVASDQAGWDFWGNALDDFLKSSITVAAAKPALELEKVEAVRAGASSSGAGQGTYIEAAAQADR